MHWDYGVWQFVLTPKSRSDSPLDGALLKNFLSLGVVLAFVAVALIALNFFLVYKYMEQESIWRPIAAGALPVALGLLRTVAKIPAVRFWFSIRWNQLLGPTYEVSIGGIFKPTLSTEDECQLLNLGVEAARKTHAGATRDAILDNRVMIKAGRTRTIRMDVLGSGSWDSSSDDQDESFEFDSDGLDGYPKPVEWQVDLELRGYNERAPRISSLIEKEVAPLLGGLNGQDARRTGGAKFLVERSHAGY